MFAIFLSCLSFFGSAIAQESETEICIDFRVARGVIERDFNNNAERLEEIIRFLQEIKNSKDIRIMKVEFCGSVSPEGSSYFNQWLSRTRMETLERYVRDRIDIPDSLVAYDDKYIAWGQLKEMVKSSEELDEDTRSRILQIILLQPDPTAVDHLGKPIDSRILALKQLDNGKVWKDMHRLFFLQMRSACALIITYERSRRLLSQICRIPVQDVQPSELLPVTPVEIQPHFEEWTPGLYVKSNGIGWMMLISNAAVEVDLCRHWSFTLPVYYSALDYFTRTIKFRTFAVQPELRYWFNANEGWFVGAHFGLAYYNYAVQGDWRIQDHNRETPAMGGGLSGGYRMSLGKNERWHLEFTLGAGVYPVHYDKFHNERNGLLYESKKKTFFGVDNAAVTIAYKFDLKKKRY